MVNDPPTGTTPGPTVVDPSKITSNTDAMKDNTAAVHDNSRAQRENRDVVQQSSAQLDDYNSKVQGSSAILAAMTGGLIGNTSAFQEMNKVVSNFMETASRQTRLTTDQMSIFSTTVTGVLGATQSFKGASFEHLNTFGGQLDSLIEPIKDNREALGMLANQIGLALPNSVKGSASAIASFIKNMSTSADNAVKLEDVYIRSAAATGRLGDVHKAAGTDLEKINGLIRDQRSAINQSIIATNLSKDTVESYYQQLQQLPVAMKGTMTAEQSMRANTDVLTKTIQLARGTGRDYKDVLEDMKVAVNDYNASVPEAMKYTAQISELSQKYNIQLSDVQNALKGSADAFKMFGNEAEGAANIMNEYVGALKNTGISGQVASDIVGNMTKQIGQLTIAQKAFLSAQSGGPGGLMGAYSIDMKLRQGKLDEVFNMTKNQLTKMMGGNLVSLEQAQNSPQAAAQMTKQIMMLRQGPLGQFARTDQEAERIIEAFKSGRSSDFKELAKGDKAVEDATKLGNEYAEQTATGVSKMVAIMEEARGEASGGALNLFQAGFTARAGDNLKDRNIGAVQERQRELRQTMATGARNVAAPDDNARAIKDAAKAMSAVPVEVSSAIKGIGNMFTPEGARRRAEVEADFAAKAKAETDQALKIQSKPAQDAELARIANEREAFKKAMQAQADMQQTTPTPEFLKPQRSALGAIVNTGGLTTLPGAPGPIVTPGSQLGSIAGTNAQRAAAAAAAGGAPGAIVPGGAAFGGRAPGGAPSPLGEIVVKVEGYCLNCKEKMEGSEHREAISVGSKVKQ